VKIEKSIHFYSVPCLKRT